MGLEHIETVVANNQPTVDFNNVFDGTANRYILFIDSLIADVSDNDNKAMPRVRVSSDGGATWDSGTSDYTFSAHAVGDSGSTWTNAAEAESYGQLSWDDITGEDATNNDNALLTTTIHHPEDSSKSTVLRSKTASFRSGRGSPQQAGFAGSQRLEQSSIDSLRFFISTGDITYGLFSLYAVTEDSGGAKQHIETIEADNQSSVDFTDVFKSDDGYDRYQIYYDNIVSEVDSVNGQIRMSPDSGSTWDSGSSDYAHSHFHVREDGGTNSMGSSGNDVISDIPHNVGNDPSSNDVSSGVIFLSDPTNPDRATVLRESSTSYRSGRSSPYQARYSGGIRLTQSAIDSIQFFMDSGDIASGTFSVYGIGE